MKRAALTKRGGVRRAREEPPRPSGGVQVRLLICDTCAACWPTERAPEHGGSRSDGEPCAYTWAGGKVCRGRVHPMGYVPHGERDPFESPRPRAYTGEWCEVLGVPLGTRDLALVRARYRTLAKVRHPDAGGTHEDMVALNEAYRQALAEVGG